MTALDLIEQRARAAERLHRGFHDRLRLEFALTVDSPDAHTNRALTDLRYRLTALRAGLQETQGEMLVESMDEVSKEAIGNSTLSSDTVHPVISRLLQAREEGTRSALSDAMKLDVDQALAVLRKLQMRAAFVRQQTGATPQIAFNMVKDGANKLLDLKRLDRAGKAWDSAIYTRTTFRGALVWAYVETYCLLLTSHGIDVATVEGETGQVDFSITGATAGLPELDDVAEQFFHPNASRLITHR